MRAGWHILLCRVLQIPAIGGFFVFWLYALGSLGEAVGLDANRQPWVGWVFFILILVLGIFSGCFVVEWLFREVIPARCPECGGRFRLGYEKRRGERFAVYVCDECGHRWEWKSRAGTPVDPGV